MGASSMFTDSGVEVPLFQAWISNTYIFEDIEDQYKDEILQENGERKRPDSYTHIRAYETVLHVVCRLLFEQKDVQN